MKDRAHDSLATVFREAELHRLLIESVHDCAIFALDTAGCIRSWNAGARQITGYTADEVMGRPFSVFFTEEDRRSGEPARELEIAARDERYEGEGWRIRKGGACFWAQVVVTPLRDESGATIGFAKVTRDLTIRRELEERKRHVEKEAAAQEAASESARRYRLLFDSNPLPLWVHDRKTLRFLDVNDAAVQQYGYSRQEFLSMTIEQIHPPEEVASLRLALKAAPRKGQRTGSWRHRRKNGQIVDVNVVANSIEFAGRDAALVLAHDVTERRRAEIELRESMAVLRAVVDNSPLAIIVLDPRERITRWNPAAERMFGWSSDEMLGQPYSIMIPEEMAKEHARLQEALLRGEMVTDVETQRRRRDGSLVDVVLSIGTLRDPDGPPRGFAILMADVTERRKLEMRFRQALKMEAVGQLAGGIAHDFNNILTVITSYSSLLLAQIPSDNPMRSDVEQIGSAANRASSLTRQLLAFSRQQLLRPRVLNLNEVVRELEGFLRRLVRENIDIVTSLDPDLGHVEADPGQMDQVIINLAVNSRDAMPEGGTLCIRTANAVFDETSRPRFEDLTMPPGRYALLSISDTGVGIPPEIQARVFEPFYTTKAPGEGTGLGLATVYGIVKQSGGYIWLSSEPGKGTTFDIYLPLTAKSAEVAGRERARTGRLNGSETILLVEDDAVLRAVACRAVRAYGYEVLEASNGREALELCESREAPIHLVVSDVVMPEMSGSDLARRIAEQHPEVKVLLMSGHMRDPVVRRSIVRDGRAFLPKPFTPELLVERIREVLDSGATDLPD